MRHHNIMSVKTDLVGAARIALSQFEYRAGKRKRAWDQKFVEDSLKAAIERDGDWTQTPPTKQGWYWHWNGDEDCAPLPTSILYSGFSGKCFVTMGQLGINEAIDCDKYGGWWKPLVEPNTPLVQDSPLPPPRARRKGN